MGAKKPKRGSPAVDMTAMVDVAFLLLTFFILTTTKFREDQSVEVDTPSSVSDLKPPDTKLMTVVVSNEGNVYAGFSDISTRESALSRAIQERQLNISPDGFKYFSSLTDFGVTFENGEFEKWINIPHEDREEWNETVGQQGMRATPTDTLTGAGNDLRDWVRWGRLADREMRFAIKGDNDAPYRVIKEVISSLQDWNINQFSLVTKLEEGGVVEAEVTE